MLQFLREQKLLLIQLLMQPPTFRPPTRASADDGYREAERAESQLEQPFCDISLARHADTVPIHPFEAAGKSKAYDHGFGNTRRRSEITRWTVNFELTRNCCYNQAHRPKSRRACLA